MIFFSFNLLVLSNSCVGGIDGVYLFLRMESSYRTWIHAIKDTSGSWNLEELRRDLQTNLGTTKWQVSFLHFYRTHHFFQSFMYFECCFTCSNDSGLMDCSWKNSGVL